MDVQTGLTTLLVVSLVAAVAPFVSALLARIRLPQVVVFIVGGVLIGPEVLGWAEPAAITLLANVGLGFLFLLAGYELDLDLFREHVGRRAIVAWFVTAGLAVAVTGVLSALGFVRAFVPVAIGLTTTAFGALLPILRDNDMFDCTFGRFVVPGRPGVCTPTPVDEPTRVREDIARGRERDVADDLAHHRLPDVRPARRRRTVRSRHRAGRVPGWCGSTAVGARGR